MKGETKEWFTAIMLIFGLLISIALIGAYAFQSESAYMDYIYSTKTNTTATGYINTSVNGTQTLMIGDIADIIRGETIIKTLNITAENTDTTNRIITVYLNSVVLGNMTAINQSNSTTLFEDVNFVQNSKNILTYVPVANTGEDLKILNVTGVYPSGRKDVKFDGIMSLLVSVLSIIIVVIIGIEFLKKI